MGLEIEVGDTVDGRFRIDDVVCRGGMATIFKATDLQRNEVVALKAPYLRFESDPTFFSRFQREEKIGALLRHPGILRIDDVPEKSRPYIVMELLEGKTLEQTLSELKPMPVNLALGFLRRICDALSYMHRHGVIHRDLKPANIMVCKDGSMRIMDFGIARTTRHRRITFAGITNSMGTPDYMAPEQVRGKGGDERTDIYSLGVILYEMLTGAPLFEGDVFVTMNSRVVGDPVAPRELNKEIPPEVEEIVLHCLERDPAKRYPDVLALKADLDAPENVKVTGRAMHLVKPVFDPNRAHKKLLLFALLPLVLFGLIYFFSKFKG